MNYPLRKLTKSCTNVLKIRSVTATLHPRFHATKLPATQDKPNQLAADSYLDRLRASGTSHVLGYWTLFGSLTGAGALTAETLVHNAASTVQPGLAAAGFLTVVGGTTLVQYLALKLSKGGSGPSIATSMGGQEVTSNADPKYGHVYDMVKEMSSKAKIDVMPRVYAIPTHEKNAFAAGFTPRDSAVAVTDGLMQTLNKNELKAVIGHEIGHLCHGDVKTGTHLGALVTGMYVTYILGRILLQSMHSNGNDDGSDRNKGVAVIGYPLLAAGISTYAVGKVLQLWVSRHREYNADAAGAALVNPDHMISALKKISSDHVDVRQLNQAGFNESKPAMAAFRRDQFAHLFIAPVAGASAFKGGVFSIFSTHPSLEQRLKNLEKVREEIQKN